MNKYLEVSYSINSQKEVMFDVVIFSMSIEWPIITSVFVTPRATSNNMRIQHISISKLDSFDIRCVDYIPMINIPYVSTVVYCYHLQHDACLSADMRDRCRGHFNQQPS